MRRLPDSAVGIGLVIAAGCMLAVQDALGKHLAGEYAVAQVVWARFGVHSVLVLAWLWLVEGDLGFLRARRPGLQVLRSLLMLSVTACMYTAFVVVPLADATAVLFFAPVLVTLLAGPFLGERLGLDRVIGVVVGFSGVLLIVRPGFDTDPYMLLPVAAAGTLTMYLLLTRYIGSQDRRRSTLFYTTAAGSVVLTAIVPWHWQTPGPWDAVLMLAMGSLGALGHGSFVVAFGRTPASVLSPFLYIQILAASVLSVAVFGDPLAWPTIAGGGLLISGGLLIWWWENRAPAGSD